MLSLVPLLWASFYAHPAWDDFRYGLLVHQAVEAGGGVLDVLSAALRSVCDTYKTWQGTFSAVFVFSLMPGAFSEDLYGLTTFIMIGSLVFSTCYYIFAPCLWPPATGEGHLVA